MRLINADALIEAMGEEPYVWTDSDDEIAERNQWLTDMHIIENAPSIDIVRCAECKYWEESQYYQGFMVCTYVKGATFTRQHDDFCSRGERKESE